MAIADALKTHVQVIVRGTLAASGVRARPTTNVLYYRRTNFPANYGGTAFLTAFQTAVQASWLAFASASWNWDGTDARIINDPTELASVAVVNLPGGVAGDPLPSYAACLLSKSTGFRTGHYRGRIFVAGIPEGGNVGNALSAGQKTLADTLATALMGNVTDANGIIFTPYLLAASLSNLRIATPTVQGADIAAFTAQQKISIQKRRKA